MFTVIPLCGGIIAYPVGTEAFIRFGIHIDVEDFRVVNIDKQISVTTTKR